MLWTPVLINTQIFLKYLFVHVQQSEAVRGGGEVQNYLGYSREYISRLNNDTYRKCSKMKQEEEEERSRLKWGQCFSFPCLQCCCDWPSPTPVRGGAPAPPIMTQEATHLTYKNTQYLLFYHQLIILDQTKQ